MIQIDQDGLSPGTPGVSRTDGLATGALVTLTNTGSGATAFRLLWVPPGDTTAVPSLAPTDDPKVWTFSPTENQYGSYRIELVETGEIRVLVIRTPNLGLVIPAFSERGDPGANLMIADAAQIDAAENNAVDYAESALNSLQYAGWWRALHEVITRIDAPVEPLYVSAVLGRNDEYLLCCSSTFLNLAAPNILLSYTTAVGNQTRELLRGTLGSDVWSLGFFGAPPVTRPSITGTTTQQQVDSLVAALTALGLVTDDR
jgi:hypothetical protein